MAENKNIEVGGRLHSIATGNVLAGANEVFDDDKGKKQSVINTETYSLVNDVNERLSGLSPDQQSALNVATKATNNETKLGYYVCSTEGDVAAKVVADATGYILSTGGSIKVKMTNTNTANNATLNINSTGAKALYYDGERASANNSWEAGETVEVYYDGTSFYANNVAGGSGSGDGAFDVSVKYPTSGVDGGNTYTLEGALAVLNANLSASKKKGGMSIKFIHSYDNKYVQYRLMSDEFTTDIAQWQGVDEEIVSGSKNLVEGKAVFDELYNTIFNDLELTNNRGGFVKQSTGEIGNPESDNWRLYYFPCSKGDRFKVKYTSWNSTAAAAYSVFNNNTIEDSSIASMIGPLGESDIEYDVVISDSNAKWFVVQEKLNTTTQTFQFGCSVKKAINTNKIIQQMFNSKDWIVDGNVVYDNNEIPVSCDIRWADGTLGTLVYSDFNDNVFEYTILTATYNTQTIVYTLTFDENGYITNETINIQ